MHRDASWDVVLNGIDHCLVVADKIRVVSAGDEWAVVFGQLVGGAMAEHRAYHGNAVELGGVQWQRPVFVLQECSALCHAISS